MVWWVVLSVLALMAANFILRVALIWKDRFRGCDAYYFLLCSEVYRQKSKLPITLPYIYTLEYQEQRYPPGMSVFLAHLPQRLLTKYYWAVTPLLDSLILALLFAITYRISGDNLIVAIIASAFYMINAASITDCVNLNSRLLGALLFNIAMLMIGLGVVLGNHIGIILLAIIAGYWLIMSHKLSSQQFYFTLPLLSLVLLDSSYIVMLLIIIGISLLFSRHMIINIWKGQYDILSFWRKNWKLLGANQIYNSPVYNGENYVDNRQVFQPGIKGMIKNAQYMGFNAYAIMLVFPLLHYTELFMFDRFMVWWALSVYILAGLTIFVPQLRFAGEGYRYLKLAALPVCYLAVMPIFRDWQNIAYYVFMAIASIISVIIVAKLYDFMSKPKKTSVPFLSTELKEAMGYLGKSDDVKLIHCIPDNISDAVGYFTRKPVLRGTHNSPFKWDDLLFPVHKLPLEYLTKYYGISHILLNNNDVEPCVLGLSRGIAVMDNSMYSIYKVGVNELC